MKPISSQQSFYIFRNTGVDLKSVNHNLDYDQAFNFLAFCFSTTDRAVKKAKLEELLGGAVMPATNAPAPVKPNFAAIYAEALEAGQKAAQGHTPQPMIVGTPTSLFSNQIDFSKPVERVNDGVCGFAWVNVRDGRSAFAKWLSSNGYARKSYRKGLDIWIGDYNQSMEKKFAHACAMAEVFTKHGFESWADSRMD